MIVKEQEFYINGLTYTIVLQLRKMLSSYRKLEFRLMEKLKIWIEMLERDL